MVYGGGGAGGGGGDYCCFVRHHHSQHAINTMLVSIIPEAGPASVWSHLALTVPPAAATNDLAQPVCYLINFPIRQNAIPPVSRPFSIKPDKVTGAYGSVNCPATRPARRDGPQVDQTPGHCLVGLGRD